ncbi:chondroitin sulfate synthase sqv-5-like [Biomphalaria glabrata]|uniref:Hexosyltransferase n=1 Tax=Biomphalaria glabrata TaxID=6526 RepID=A0A9W2Z1G4_BIOGL|nr:chondroitin sulfate synthase sqv-5-like [Biomphalaria glabrata]XP_013068593.2 chondroitin sulfate synthase sqv-5-like [Biomphalaria glabrata]XP_055868896.1 chondroitin sulfate synthase sqv-5-like [Biomphalaria glabrata]XP_055868897.1 chondroitin sulfate synthase sqv-5-like [Biomphalaria glabrata]
MAVNRRCRTLCTMSVFFVLGFLLGHVMWKHARPVFFVASISCNRTWITPDTQFGNDERLQLPELFDASEDHRFPRSVEDAKNDYSEEDLSEEDGDNFLFIGIMTARKFLNSRAFASSRTWVPRVPGKVVYFLGEGEEYTGDLNVIQLKGVKENDYPPQKKSFAMVEYMSEHFAPHYKWLIRADDDVYMKVDELVRFLKSVDDRRPLYIGQPGFGKAVEAGKLGLAGSFCMGGPGVIMSRKVVTGVAPGLQECLKVTVTGHEDTELGRCITINTGVQCTLAFQMKDLFYQNYQELDEPNSSFKKKLGKAEMNALTLHPLKEAAYVFRMDNFFNNITLQKLYEKKTTLLAEIEPADKYIFGAKGQPEKKDALVSSSRGAVNEVSTYDKFFTNAVERRGEEIINLENIRLLPKVKSIYQGHDKSWEYIRYKRMFSTTFETGKLEFPIEFKRRTELHLEMTGHLKSYPENAKLKLQFVNETYHRLTTDRGVEVMLFLKKWYQKKKYVQPVYLRKPFLPGFVDFREADHLDEENEGQGSQGQGKTIHMLMPLYQRSAIYKRFLEMHARAIVGYRGKVELRVVVFTDDRGEHKLLSAMTSTMMSKIPSLDIRMTYLDEPFNRGKGLMTALSDLPYTSLLLFMDVDMEYSSYFLHRVSKYTVQGRSTFFPIYFVHFNPDSICYKQKDCDSLLNSRRDEVGLWRSFSYGIGSVYKSDLVRAGGFKTDIVGWGLEDVDFYEKCISLGLNVMRGSDPSMIHRYHPRECNMSLPENQLKQCIDSGSAMLGSVQNLYRMLYDVSKGKGV